jgi:L-amino acid N-acyltransferase YncA
MLLRLATPADAERLAAIYAPAVTDHATSFELEAPTPVEMARRLGVILTRTPWLVGERDGRVLGYAYASPHRDRPAYQWSVEVSAYVDAAAHRVGLGRLLYTHLFGILERQGFVNAYAAITLPNPASVGFHRSMGFTDVGIYEGIGHKFGRWHDVIWLHRGLAPRLPGAEPPLLLPALMARDGVGDLRWSPGPG